MESADRSKGPSPLAEPVLTAPPRSFGRLLKPLVFTVAFTGCSFGTAAIWQYESLKSRVQSYFDEERADWLEKLRPQKEGDIRKQTEDWGLLSEFQKRVIVVVVFQVNRWWNSLSEGQRTVTGIIAANVLVFCLWRVPSMQRTMMRYFTSNPAASCSFGTAAIWQYESLKSRVQSYFDEERADWLEKLRPQKEGDIRKQTEDWGLLSEFQKRVIVVVVFQVNRWWNSLSEGQRTVTGIIAANVLVFCLWRVPSMQRTMMRYFTSNPAAKDLCFPMIFSTFSHYSLFHMAANMYVLWSFSSSAVSLLGREQFMAVYLSAGVISTFASYICKTASGRLGPSLGASGAIMTILAAVCMKMPEAKLAVIFLPMFTFTAGSALKAIVAMDTAGLVLGWRLFDHAAHLGGALFGM
ncbi:UNVERIFIED_CONTAM: hypothetical protein FKN15_069160 [Acipenser sinensis]